MDGRAEDAEIAGLQRLIDAPDRVLVLHGIRLGLSVVDATVIPHGWSICPSDQLQKCHSRSESIPAPMLRSTKQAPPARRMRLQRSSAAGRVSAPIPAAPKSSALPPRD